MGYLYILLAATCWGLLGPVARIAFDAGVDPIEVAFWRAALGGLLFFGHVGVSSSSTRIQRRDYPAVIGFGVVGVALFYGGYQLAVESGGAALASVLLYTAPAWVAVMSALWFSERITSTKLVAIVLTIAGVTGLAIGGGNTAVFSIAALFWGLLSGFCYALYYPFGRIYFRKYSPSRIYAFALPIGALVLLPFTDFAFKPAAAWGAIAVIALVSTYGAYLAYGQALQYLQPTRASILAALEPVVAGALAFWWWSEQFTTLGYAGALLVLVAVYLAIRERESPPEPAAATDEHVSEELQDSY